jgi:hypothetical protein
MTASSGAQCRPLSLRASSARRLSSFSECFGREVPGKAPDTQGIHDPRCRYVKQRGSFLTLGHREPRPGGSRIHRHPFGPGGAPAVPTASLQRHRRSSLWPTRPCSGTLPGASRDDTQRCASRLAHIRQVRSRVSVTDPAGGQRAQPGREGPDQTPTHPRMVTGSTLTTAGVPALTGTELGRATHPDPRNRQASPEVSS